MKVLTSMAEQITAAARVAEDAKGSLDLALKQRDALIVEAIDSGELSQRAAARAAGFTGPSAIARILAKPHD